MSADKTELRGLVPAHLAAALDAIAMAARGMDRHSYVTAVLDAEVKRVAHEAMELAWTARKVRSGGEFKYFCGICWNKIKGKSHDE
jgi:hypothetical protein